MTPDETIPNHAIEDALPNPAAPDSTPTAPNPHGADQERNHMKLSVRILAAIAVTLVLLGVTLYGRSASAQPESAPVAPPAPVATPVVATVPVTQTYPAIVEAIERVELRPQIAGPIESIHFDEGAEVSKHQLLVRIDARPFIAALAEAEAALAQAEADSKTARREDERAERLTKRNAIAVEDAERRRAHALASSARVDAARAAVDRARLNLSYTEVRSPIAGRIGRAEVTRGNLVGPDTRLAVVVATDPVYVRFDVDENTLSSTGIAGSKKWKVEFSPASAASPLPAEIAFVENEIAAGTGTLRVRARLANAGQDVIPGMYGTARLTLGDDSDAILVREDVIAADQGLRYVLVAGKDDVLEYRPVTLGARIGELRVIKGGLTPEDRVVVNGHFRLRPGMPVTPQTVAMTKEN
jgi:membrane fusion protein, multidrug efflux system